MQSIVETKVFLFVLSRFRCRDREMETRGNRVMAGQPLQHNWTTPATWLWTCALDYCVKSSACCSCCSRRRRTSSSSGCCCCCWVLTLDKEHGKLDKAGPKSANWGRPCHPAVNRGTKCFGSVAWLIRGIALFCFNLCFHEATAEVNLPKLIIVIFIATVHSFQLNGVYWTLALVLKISGNSLYICLKWNSYYVSKVLFS